VVDLAAGLEPPLGVDQAAGLESRSEVDQAAGLESRSEVDQAAGLEPRSDVLAQQELLAFWQEVGQAGLEPYSQRLGLV